MRIRYIMNHAIGAIIFPTSYFAAWPRLCGFQAKLASAEWPWWTRTKSAIHWLLPFSRTPWHHQITINIYQPIHNSFAVNTNLMSLSIIVSFIPLHSYVKDSFLPIGTLLAKGKPPALGKTSSEVDALEPSHSILSGSTEYRRRLDWHEKVSRLGSWYLERSSGVAWMWVAQESCSNRSWHRSALSNCNCWS